MHYAPVPAAMVSLVVGGGVVRSNGNFERPGADIGGVWAATWCAGLEFGVPRQSGVKIQLARSWFGRDLLSATGISTISLLYRSK